ncbi:MAG TPA: GNAT family N-acetyltransferase [Bacteroidales bacterium]|nr:GNAT family N-acetyltransferase [Bacteroidales bacterium]HRZ48807.1 GNAT family N-acetyltransferase [Bacteroidales bacterium]
MIEIRQFEFSDSTLFALARKIRYEVFIEEQKVPESLEYEHEESAVHYLLLEDGEPRATARWRETPAGIKLERFAVPSPFRNLGLGTVLLERVMKDVRPLGKPIYLHAQTTAVNYYLRAGFVPVGKEFEEAGIRHYKMVYTPSGK